MITLEKFMSEMQGEKINEIVAAGGNTSSMKSDDTATSESSLKTVGAETSSSC